MPDDNRIRIAMEKAPKLCSTDAELLLREAYEITYGLFNHDDMTVDRPLALVAMHPGENTAVGSTLYGRIEQFAELEIAKYFGISLIEFFELPTDVVNKIMETSAGRQAVERKVSENVATQLGADKS